MVVRVDLYRLNERKHRRKKKEKYLWSNTFTLGGFVNYANSLTDREFPNAKLVHDSTKLLVYETKNTRFVCRTEN